MPLDCLDSLKERQKMIERQRRELEDLEREADHEVMISATIKDDVSVDSNQYVYCSSGFR